MFVSNYIELLYHAYALHECGMDKYYHSVANCQCAQLGELETEMATGFSDLKELYEQYTYVHRALLKPFFISKYFVLLKGLVKTYSLSLLSCRFFSSFNNLPSFLRILCVTMC